MAKAYQKPVVLLGGVELTPKQNDFLKIMTNENTKIVFLRGPAGTAKTFLSVYAALFIKTQNKKAVIQYLRSVVESSSRPIGFIKGEIDQKFAPYAAPFYDKLSELLTQEEITSLERTDSIAATPINYLRGLDWKNTIAIADESQNLTIKEIVTIITRLNLSSKIFLCGDVQQSDIKNSGFQLLCSLFDNEQAKQHGIFVLDFDKNDIMRDPVINFIIDTLEKEKVLV